MQTAASKPLKAMAINKAKKSSVPSSPVTSPATSPTKQQPAKAKKSITQLNSAPSTLTESVSGDPCAISVSTALAAASALAVSSNRNSNASTMDVDLEDATEQFLKPTREPVPNHAKSWSKKREDEAASTSATDSSSRASDVESKAKPTKKGSTNKPYKCGHCTHRAATENAINLHWQRYHCAENLPLEFECDLPSNSLGSQPEQAKIFYKCLHCGVTGMLT